MIPSAWAKIEAAFHVAETPVRLACSETAAELHEKQVNCSKWPRNTHADLTKNEYNSIISEHAT